jgi:uncharacterized OB-fold protein
MRDKPLVPAIDGWYTMNMDEPHLIGSQCQQCATYFFPKTSNFCKNPSCQGTEFDDVELSRTGKVWSYTNASYQPPKPFVAPDPFVPYAIAAVQLEKEQMVVLGQVVAGTGCEDLRVGMEMELVLEQLHEDEEDIKVAWKWKPVKTGASA